MSLSPYLVPVSFPICFSIFHVAEQSIHSHKYISYIHEPLSSVSFNVFLNFLCSHELVIDIVVVVDLDIVDCVDCVDIVDCVDGIDIVDGVNCVDGIDIVDGVDGIDGGVDGVVDDDDALFLDVDLLFDADVDDVDLLLLDVVGVIVDNVAMVDMLIMLLMLLC
jgi:hypothetical protein